MAIDRESTIRKAERLLKQGKLEAAITAYVQAVEDQPRDWNTVNILGDLFARAGQIENAVHQYTRVAEHFAREGFFQKAAALYKKIVKIRPQDEGVLLQLAELSEQQGLIADAKSCLSTIAEHRRRRGDRQGSAEVVLRLAKLDPTDLSAAMLAARAAGELGDTAGATERFKAAGSEFFRRGRTDEGLKALSEAVALNPADDQLRRSLMQAYLDAGQVGRARQYGATTDDAAIAQPTEESSLKAARADRGGHRTRKGRASRHAGPDDAAPAETPVHRAERELRAGRYDAGLAILGPLVAEGNISRAALLALGQALGDVDTEAAFACVDLATDAAISGDDFEAAASALEEFVRRVPDHVPALMKLIEVSVDGGLDQTMYAAQAQLADAYLLAGRAADARVIAEDLVAREPWRRENVDRLRRALIALREAEPDRIIADHLSGASPFALTELWEKTGLEHVTRTEPEEPALGPPPEPFDDVEIELDFRALAEADAVVEADGAVERVFDQLLDAHVLAAAPAEGIPEGSPETGPTIEPEPGSSVESPPALLDRPFEELLETAPDAEVAEGPVVEPSLPAFDGCAALAGDEAAACEASAEAANPPAPTFELVPPPHIEEDAQVFDRPDESTVEPSPELGAGRPAWDWPTPAPDQDRPEATQVDELLSPLQIQPTWDWSEAVAVVDTPVEGDLKPLAPPALAESIEDLLGLVPAVDATVESAGDQTIPAAELPADAVTEPAPAPDVSAETGTAPAHEAVEEPAQESVEEAAPGLGEPVDLASTPALDLRPAAELVDELADLAIVLPRDSDLESVVEPAEQPAPIPEEPADLAIVSAPEPELEPVLEPLVASLPAVAELAESIVIVDAAPDAEAGLTFEGDADLVAREEVPVTPPLEPVPIAPEPIAESAEVDLSIAIGELRAGIQPAVIEDAVVGPEPAVAQADDLDRVFQMFRDEAALRGLADMGVQHLKLAEAYREIGMMDECIGALEMAARSPRHCFEAAALLAETLRDQGRTREAIEWFERAAEAPAPGAEAGRGLLYELGKTLSDVGESERALAVFLELQADAPDYRDVAVRVRRLSSAT